MRLRRSIGGRIHGRRTEPVWVLLVGVAVAGERPGPISLGCTAPNVVASYAAQGSDADSSALGPSPVRPGHGSAETARTSAEIRA